MKKSFLFLSAIALALASCGGGQQTQNSDETATDTTANVTDVVDTVSTTTDTETSANADADIKQCIAYEVLLKYAEKYNYPSKQMVENQFDSDIKDQLAKDPEFVEASPGDGMMRLRCYPYKNGGYYVLVIFDLVCDCPGAYSYEYFNYKDGNLTKAKSLLPKPTINDFYANADKFPKNVFNILKSRATKDAYHYFHYDSHKLTASFEGIEWDGEFVVPAPLKKYYEKKGYMFSSITYIWDGEKFIRDPECKPFEEDLSLFGVSDESAAASNGKVDLRIIWDRIIDLSREEDLGICKDCWTIEYHEDAPVPYFEQLTTKGALNGELYCYTVKDHYKIYYIDTDDNGYYLWIFEYKNNTMSQISESEIPTDKYREFYISEDGKEFIAWKSNPDGNNGNVTEEYLWNGEKFIKQ